MRGNTDIVSTVLIYRRNLGCACDDCVGASSEVPESNVLYKWGVVPVGDPHPGHFTEAEVVSRAPEIREKRAPKTELAGSVLQSRERKSRGSSQARCGDYTIAPLRSQFPLLNATGQDEQDERKRRGGDGE